jgi:hypothetical protein
MQNNGFDLTITPTSLEGAAAAAPSSEVRAKRRIFTAAQKLAILREIDACPEGKVGEVLRRYGIYSSHLSKWRQMRAAGDLVAKKRGPKVDEQAQRLAQVEREKAQLTARLHKAELIIDAQKKLLQVLGLPEPDLTELDRLK